MYQQYISQRLRLAQAAHKIHYYIPIHTLFTNNIKDLLFRCYHRSILIRGVMLSPHICIINMRNNSLPRYHFWSPN